MNMTRPPLRGITAALALVLCAGASLQAAPTISFTTAKAKAAREGKVLLVDFTAEWCMPCRWMDETTFADAQVLAYLREHYVSIKVDIDDFDGFALKQRFAVGTLPTMIFFASDGEVVGRVEEGIGAAEMLDVLARHNQPRHRRRVGTSPAPADDWSEPFARATNPYAEEDPRAPAEYVRLRRSTVVPTSPALLASTRAEVAPAIAAAKPTPTHVPAVATPCPSRLASADRPQLTVPTPAALVASGQAGAEGELTQASPPRMSAAERRIFSLQVGAFSNRDNAARAADHLRGVVDSPVLVEFDEHAGKSVYRIYVGRFADIAEAEALGRRLQLHGLSSITRELVMN